MENIPALVATFLDKEIPEVKAVLKDMPLAHLVELLRCIDDDDKEKAFKIFSGSAV